MSIMNGELPAALVDRLDEIQIDALSGAISIAGEKIRDEEEWSVGDLARALYVKWHAGSRRPLNERVAPRDLFDPDFLRPLLTGLAGRRSVSRDWVVVDETPSSGVIVQREGLRVLVPAAHVAGAVQDGHAVTVSIPSVRPALSPGFVMIDSLVDVGATRRGATMRIYAYLDVVTAPETVRRTVALLDATGISFRIKLLASPLSYPRYDSCVLYVAEDTSSELLLSVAGVLGEGVGGAEVSPYVAQIAPGIGFAWQPAEPVWPPESFGQHRVRLTADAIAEWAGGDHCAPDPGLAAAVADHLMVAGIEPDAPWREFVSPSDPLFTV